MEAETFLFTPRGLSEIKLTIGAAIRTSAEVLKFVQFDFNGVTVVVAMDSNAELIYRDYMRAVSGLTETSVGPYPSPIVSDEEKESDARIQAEKDRCYQAWLDGKIAEHELS